MSGMIFLFLLLLFLLLHMLFVKVDDFVEHIVILCWWLLTIAACYVLSIFLPNDESFVPVHLLIMVM